MKFTKEELYWVERSADIESAFCLNKFFEIVSIPKSNITEEELKMLQKYTTELIELYTFLKCLRVKLELIREKGENEA
jgi:hypothetical protein